MELSLPKFNCDGLAVCLSRAPFVQPFDDAALLAVALAVVVALAFKRFAVDNLQTY